jgi:hypothetical protein
MAEVVAEAVEVVMAVVVEMEEMVVAVVAVVVAVVAVRPTNFFPFLLRYLINKSIMSCLLYLHILTRFNQHVDPANQIVLPTGG